MRVCKRGREAEGGGRDKERERVRAREREGKEGGRGRGRERRQRQRESREPGALTELHIHLPLGPFPLRCKLLRELIQSGQVPDTAASRAEP